MSICTTGYYCSFCGEKNQQLLKNYKPSDIPWYFTHYIFCKDTDCMLYYDRYVTNSKLKAPFMPSVLKKEMMIRLKEYK